MGSQDVNMRLTGLCLVVLSFSYIEAQSSPPTTPPAGSSTSGGEGCCARKVVSGTANMDGTYNFVKTFDGEKDEACYDGCIYTREGKPGEEYCFKWVNSGAANINDECEAPTGTTPPMTGSSLPPPSETSPGTGLPPTGETSPPPTGETSPPPTGGSSQPPTSSPGGTSPAPSTVPTSAGSTLSPEDTISSANSVITQANAAHAVATENANTASDASTAVDDIQASLSTTSTTSASPSSVSARIKRQAASTTVGPVFDCTDFGSKYTQLLTELSSFSDNNVGLIK